MADAAYWVKKLGLQPHPEGGYFKEVYRSEEVVGQAALPERYEGERSFSTAIYFLLKGDQYSAFHHILSDELWHFYAGDSLTLFIISPEGDLTERRIGSDPGKDETFQFCIRRNHWFAAKVNNPEGFSLVGCTVAPGFEFGDFKLADKAKLLKAFPQHAVLIEEFSPQ